jgi:DNA-directed RNA polymerase subunit omega
MKIDRTTGRHVVDTDKCVENIDGNRFNLVLVAAQRVRELKRGHRKLTTGSDGATITALKEIEEGHVGLELLRKIK